MHSIPDSVSYVIVGAGIHGLSSAWHLALELKARGRGSGKDIVVLDKTGPGAGASGIACGCVRNFYMTETPARYIAPQRRCLDLRPRGSRFSTGGLHFLW